MNDRTRPCLKIGTMPRDEEFFRQTRRFDDAMTTQYFVYCKANQRRMAEKGPPFGHIDIFQTRPSATCEIPVKTCGGKLRSCIVSLTGSDPPMSPALPFVI